LDGCHDDGVQNDSKHTGTCCDNFISARHVFAARPADTNTAAINDDRSDVLWTISNNLLWVKGIGSPDLAPVGGSLGDPCTFGLIKTQSTSPGNGIGFAFHNNVVLWKGELSDSEDGNIIDAAEAASITTQSNNTLLLPNQTSGLPPSWPSAALSSFTVVYWASARTYWDSVMSAWSANHPEVVIADPGYMTS
jgi:hypothetical protein